MHQNVLYAIKGSCFFTLTAILLISLLLIGQENSAEEMPAKLYKQYKLKKVSADSSNFSTIEGYISDHYTIDSLTFLFGSFSAFQPDTTISGLRMIIKNAEDSVVYASPGFFDSETLSPLFFLNDSAVFPLLVCVDAGGFGSWGNTVFAVSKQRVKKLGHINAATYDPNDLSGNIMVNSKVSAIDDTLLVEFPADTLLLNPGGEGEQKVVGADVIYRYSGKQFEYIRKPSELSNP